MFRLRGLTQLRSVSLAFIALSRRYCLFHLYITVLHYQDRKMYPNFGRINDSWPETWLVYLDH